MTPSHLLLELWPNIHNLYPNLKFKLVSFENTPENAREILLNLGKNIDIVAGIFGHGNFCVFRPYKRLHVLFLSRKLPLP